MAFRNKYESAKPLYIYYKILPLEANIKLNQGKFIEKLTHHGCSNHSNLEMEAECLTKTLSYLNLNISRTKNDRNKL